MKKIKNKLTIAVLLFLGITVFMSCEKTKQEPRSINNESIINDFKANLNENKKIIEEKNKDNIEKSTVDVAFPLNPYDIQGQKHNEILTYFKNNGTDK